MSGFDELLIVVPTRNRAALAIAAADSVLQVGHPKVRLAISDNSTSPEHRAVLRAAAAARHLDFWTPDAPLSMADHWDWALRRARDEPSVSHISFLTDRMLMRSEGLVNLTAIVDRFPNDVVSFGHDRLDDLREPVRLEINQWTGRVVRLPSRLQATLVAESDESVNMTLPRLLNCVVPNHVLDAVSGAFGFLCRGTISPDFAFAFRCLATVPTTLFYDRSVLIHYAMDRSNGASVARGVPSADHVDFVNEVGGKLPLFDSPLPELLTVQNAVVHEYSKVRAATDWPGVSLPEFLRAVRKEVDVMDQGEAKNRAARVLAATLIAAPVGDKPVRRLARLFRLLGDAPAAWNRLLMATAGAQKIWEIVERRGDVTYPRWSSTTEIWPSREQGLLQATTGHHRPHLGLSAIELSARRSRMSSRPDRVATFRGRNRGSR